MFQSKKFNIPIISIGNLTIGGAGKSPMTEYIVRLLKSQYKVAVLSRGYGRKTKGFRLVKPEDSFKISGDEPLQFRRKFNDITVAVCEKRVVGIETLEAEHNVILLDDAYQHRAVKAGLSILLFDYTTLNDYLLVLPAGNLREPFSGRHRADILVISKCPESLSMAERERIINKIRPFKHQHLFFSYLEYNELKPLFSDKEDQAKAIKPQTTIFLLTGIANPLPLLKKVKSFNTNVIHHEYPDHHPFSIKNITKLAEEFKRCREAEKIIITTEKDAQRLQFPALVELLKDLPVYYQPVTARIHQPDEQCFNDLIENYASKYIQHNSLH